MELSRLTRLTLRWLDTADDAVAVAEVAARELVAYLEGVGNSTGADQALAELFRGDECS